MGKCRLNPVPAIDALQADLANITEDNVVEILSKNSATYAEGLHYLSGEIETSEGIQDVKTFITDTFEGILFNPDNEWTLDEDFKEYLEDVLQEDAKMDEFVASLSKAIGTEAIESSITSPEDIKAPINAFTYSEYQVQAREELVSANGSDGDGDGEIFAQDRVEMDLNPGITGKEFAMMTMVYNEPEAYQTTHITKFGPLNSNVLPERAIIDDFFYNLKEYYDSDFLPFIHKVITDEFFRHLRDRRTILPDGNVIIENAKKKFLEIADSNKIVFEDVRDGKGNDLDRRTLYAYAALEYMDTLLHSQIKYIVADANGDYILDIRNLRARTSHVSNKGRVDSYQVSQMVDGFLTSTPRLEPNGQTDDGNPLYTVSDRSPFLNKNDIILVQQFLQQEMTTRIAAKGKAYTTYNLIQEFKNKVPDKGSTEAEKILHSLIMRFFSPDTQYTILNPVTGKLEGMSSLPSEQFLPNILADEMIDTIVDSVGQLLVGAGTNIKVNLRNGVPRLSSGIKSMNSMFLSNEIVGALTAPGAENRYLLTAKDLSLVADPDVPGGYVVKMKLGKNTFVFKYDTPLGKMRLNAGAKPAAETINILSKMLHGSGDAGWNSSDIYKMMSAMHLPSGLAMPDFIHRYNGYTSGNISPELKLEYVIPNLALMLALNIPSNEAAYKKLHTISDSDIESLYTHRVGSLESEDVGELTEGQYIKYNPFKALIKTTNAIDRVLSNMHGINKSNLLRSPGSGWEYVSNPISPSQEIAKSIAFGQATDAPHGIMPDEFSPDNEMPSLTRGITMIGDQIKPTTKFNESEHFDSVVNGLFLGILTQSRGARAAFPAGSATDTGRPQGIVVRRNTMKSGYGFLPSASDKTAQGVQEQAADYHTQYYTAMRTITLTRWNTMLSRLGFPMGAVTGLTTLEKIDNFIQANNITVDQVSKYMTKELDYISRGQDYIAIKPEYIYLAEDVFSPGKKTEAIQFLREGFSEFKKSEGYKNLKISRSNLQFLRDHLDKPRLNSKDAKAQVGFGFYWRAIMMRDVFRRGTVGDVISFKGSIDRTFENDYLHEVENTRGMKEGDKATSPAELKEKLKANLIHQSLQAMMVDQAKRNSTSNTGATRIRLKGATENEFERGSYLHALDPETGKGGVNIITFEEIDSDARDILGARDEAKGNPFDGVQWMHPLFAMQFDKGNLDSHRSINGSALKPTALSNNGYGIRMVKSSMQNVFSFDNLRKSAKARAMFQVMNTAVSFNEDGSPVQMNLPRVILSKGKTSLMGLGQNVAKSVPISNLHDLYMYFGAEAGNDIYAGRSSWEFIHEYIMSGKYDTGVSEISREWTNKYVGFVGNESAIKTGNNKVNRGDAFRSDMVASDIEIDIFDPHNLGSILNSAEDMDNTEGEDESAVKVSTQVMRIIGTNSNDVVEAEVVRVTRGLLADIGYTKQVVDKIFDSKVRVLLEEVNNKTIDETELPQALYRQFADFLKVWNTAGSRAGAGLYTELKAITDKGGDQLTFMGTDLFLRGLVTKGLENIDPSLAKAFTAGDLTYDSKQVENVVTETFKSEVNKSTIKQSFNGSHTVLGPSHGIIPIYNVFIGDNFAISMTQDEYASNPKMPYRSIAPADVELYTPLIFMETKIKTLDLLNPENLIESTVAERVYQRAEEEDASIEDIFQDELKDLIATPGTEFKIPDIKESRDLGYSHYVKRSFDTLTGKVVIAKGDGINEKTGRRNIADNIINSDAFSQLTQAKQRKLKFQPIEGTRRFEDKNDASSYIDENFGMIKEGSLFAIGNKVFKFSEGALKWYKDYTKDSKYTKEEFALANLSISYDDYKNSRLSTEDINNDIYRANIDYARDIVQESLDETIQYTRIESAEFGIQFIELQDNYTTKQEFTDVLSVLEQNKGVGNPLFKQTLDPGHYLVAGELVSVGVPSLGEITEIGEVQVEDAWLFQPMELIQSHHYKKQFSMDENTTMADFLGEVDYSTVSRAQALEFSNRALIEGDSSIYKDNAPSEYKALFNKAKKDIQKATTRDKSSDAYKVFNSGIIRRFKQGKFEDGLSLLEDEQVILSRLLKNNPEYYKELEQRRRFIQEAVVIERAARNKAVEQDEAHDTIKRITSPDELYNLEQEYEKTVNLRNVGTTVRLDATIGNYSSLISKSETAFIEETAESLALAFNHSLMMFSTRIPSQDMQSYTKGMIVSFSHGSGNTVFSPLDLIIISGADYDIDKLFNLIYHITKRGDLPFLEGLNIPNLLIDGKPNKAVLKEYVDREMNRYAEKAFKEYDTIEEATEAISKYKKYFLNNIGGRAHNHMLRGIMSTVENPANAKRSQTLISTEAIKSTADKNVSEAGKLVLNSFDIASDFRLDAEGGAGDGMIGVVANGSKVHSLVWTAAAQTDLMEDGTISKFGPESILDNYMSRFDTPMTTKDILLKHEKTGFGKEIVESNPNGNFQLFLGNDKTSRRVYTGQVAGNIDKTSPEYKKKVASITNFRRRVKAKNIAPAEEVTAFMAEFDKIGLKQDFKSTYGNQLETWELFSELLSAATDNAKLLLFGRLDINYTSIGLVHTMLTMGIDLQVAFEFIKIPKIKAMIKEVTESHSILDKGAPKFLRGVLNASAKKRKKQTAIYSKDRRQVTSGTAYFSKATTKYNKSNQTQFEYEMSGQNPDLPGIANKIVIELSSPIMQLTSLLNIQDSLGIVKKVSQVIQGMHSKDFDVRSEMKSLEYRIIQRLQGIEEDDVIDREAADGSGQFNIDEFFTNEDTRETWIKKLGESEVIGYNFLEVISRNPDLYEFKAIQTKTQEVINVVQKTATAANTLFEIIKDTDMAEIFETPIMYANVKSIIDDLIVSDYLHKNRDFQTFEIPGVEGTFNLHTKEGRRSFLHNIRGFRDHLLERSHNSSQNSDSNYHDNLFISTLQISHENDRFEEAPAYLDSPNMTNFSESQLSRMEEGLRSLDPKDQAVLEMYSLLVNKSTRSSKSFERFIDFSKIGAYTKHKSKVLHTPGEFSEVLSRTHPMTLLANVRDVILNRSTKEYEKASYEDAFFSPEDIGPVGFQRKTNASFMNFTYITPELTDENGGLFLTRSIETRQTYAAIDKFKDLLPDTNGLFPVEKNFGFNNLGFDAATSSNFKGLELLLASGLSPLPIEYSVEGQEELAKGYILGVTADGPLLVDSDFEVADSAMKYNTYADIRNLNTHLNFDGKYVGRKAPYEMNKELEAEDRTPEQMDKASVALLLRDSSTKKGIMVGDIAQMVFPGRFKSTVKENDTVFELAYNGGKALLIYDGQKKVALKEGYSSRDIKSYKESVEHVLRIEIQRAPYALHTLSPDRIGDGFHHQKDKKAFNQMLKNNKRTKNSANGVLWGNTEFIGVTEAQKNTVENIRDRVATLLEASDGRKEWFAREFFGEFTSVADLANAARQIKPNLPIESSLLHRELSIMFNAKYSPEIQAFLTGNSSNLSLFTFTPLKTRITSYRSALKLVEGKEGLIVPDTFTMRADVNFSSEITQLIDNIDGVEFTDQQIQEVGHDPYLDMEMAEEISISALEDINNILDNPENVITEEAIVDHPSNLVSGGIDFRNASSAILKVPNIQHTMTARRVAAEDVNIDTHEGVDPKKHLDKAIELMYLKKTLKERYPNTPLIVYESDTKSFYLYNFDIGMFTPILSGIPNVGNTPVIIGFQAMDLEQSKDDIDVVGAILKQRAYYDSDMNNYVPKSYVQDQDMIPTSMPTTNAMTKIVSTNTGEDAVSTVSMLAGMEGVAFHTEVGRPTDDLKGSPAILISSDRITMVGKRAVDSSKEFADISEINSRETGEEFTVSKYAEDGTVMIDVVRPGKAGLSAIRDTYAVFSSEDVRRNKYGNYSGKKVVRFLTGTLIDDNGEPLKVSIENAYLTDRDHLERRDINAEDRLEIHEAQEAASVFYTEKVRPVYNSMVASNPKFREYVASLGGPKELFKHIDSPIFLRKLSTDFNNIITTTGEGSSQLSIFRDVYDKYSEQVEEVKTMQKEYRAEIIEEYRTKTIPTLDKDPFQPDALDPTKEVVIMFSDSTMSTMDILMGIEGNVVDHIKGGLPKNASQFAYDSQDKATGGYLLNIFSPGPNNTIGFLSGKKRFQTKEIDAVIRMFKRLDSRELDSIYIDFPDLSTPIAENSDIKYEDLARLLSEAVEKLGFVPAGLKVSPNLSKFIQNNSGLTSIADIKLARQIETTNELNRVTESVQFNYLLPTAVSMSNGRTVLEEVNYRKGIRLNTKEEYAKPGDDTWLLQSQNTKEILTNVYEDYLRENPGQLVSIIKAVNVGSFRSKAVLIRKGTKSIEQLIQAVNNIAFDYDIASARPVDLGLTEVSSSGIDYKLLSPQVFTDNNLKAVKGTKTKTQLDGYTYVVEVVGTGKDILYVDAGGTLIRNQERIDELGLTGTDIESLASEGRDTLILKLYRDPSTQIVAGDYKDVVGRSLGTEAAAKLRRDFNMEMDPIDVEILDKGDVPMVMDISVPFGRSGKGSFIGEDYFNAIKTTTKNLLYTNDLEKGAIVSVVGTVIGNLDVNRARYTSNDVKQYLDLHQDLLANYIIGNKLGLAVGNRPGIEQELRARILAKPGFAIDSNGIIRYNPTDFEVQDDSPYLTIKTIPYKAFSLNNTKNRLGNISGRLATIDALGQDENGSKSVLAGKGNFIDYRYTGNLEKMPRIHSESAHYIKFWETYGEHVDENAAQVALGRNNEFITDVITRLVGAGKLELVQATIDRVIDADGNLLVYNSFSDSSKIGHAALQYAVARNKHVALMLIQNNLKKNLDFIKLTLFINEQLEADRSVHSYRGANIHTEEYNNVINSSQIPTNFELMLYDIVASKSKNIRLNLKPDQEFFFSKMLSLGEEGFLDNQFNNAGQYAPVYRIFDTSKIQSTDEISGVKVDSNPEVEYLLETDAQSKVSKFSTGLNRHLTAGKLYRYDLSGDDILMTAEGVDPKVITAYELYGEVQRDIIRDLYSRLNIDLSEQFIDKILKAGFMKSYLSKHIYRSTYGTSLLDTLFFGRKLNGLAPIEARSEGKVSTATIEGVSVNGIMLATESDGIVFITEYGTAYKVLMDIMNRTITGYERISDKGFDPQKAIEFKTVARPSRAGHEYTTIDIDGTILEQRIRIVQSINSNQLVAVAAITGEMYTYNEDSKDWTPVIIGEDFSDDMFITAQKPSDMGNHTRYIAANGQIFRVSDVSVNGNTVTTSDGWVYEYNPDTSLFSIQAKGTELPKSERSMRQKAPVVFENNNKTNYQSIKVDGKVIKRVVSFLSTKFGLNAEVLSTNEIQEEFGGNFADSLGFTYGGRIIINKDRATLDTPLHEFGHFYFRHLRQTDPELFETLKGEAFNSSVAADIRLKYPELGNDTDDLAEEILTTMLGTVNQQKVLEAAKPGIIRRFLDTMRSWFNGAFGVKDKSYDLDLTTSLSEIMDQIGTQLVYGPRSILNDMTKGEKGFLNNLMKKTITDKEAENLLRARGFIVEVC